MWKQNRKKETEIEMLVSEWKWWAGHSEGEVMMGGGADGEGGDRDPDRGMGISVSVNKTKE